MEADSIATAPGGVALSAGATAREGAGAGLGLAALGVLAFSFTFPATILAERSFDPYVVGAGRSVLAALIAGACLLVAGARLPKRRMWPGLLAVAGGCGIGFGLLSALALAHTTSTHAAVVVGLLPAATAVAAVVRAGERPGRAFWAASGVASATVVLYAVSLGGGRLAAGDVLLLAALAVGAIGYAEGGRLAREIPGWQVIAWGVILALPVSLPVTVVAAAAAGAPRPSAAALGGLAYVGGVSMFLGFAAWYRGLARAGVARASQLQLAQPLLTVAWSAALLGERVGPGALLVAVVVIACVLVTQRARIAAGDPGPPETDSRPPTTTMPPTPTPAPAPAAGPLGATERTRVHRHRERAASERADLHAVLDGGLVAHVALVVDGGPVVLPMAYARDGERLLLHGSRRNRLLVLVAGGAPVCLTVTLLDGLVLAGTAFTHSMNYRSAVVYGRGRELEDEGEKARALELVVDAILPGRSAELPPSTRQELAATLVVELPLAEASVKARTGPPKPAPGGEAGAWTGVVPLRLVRGD
jgi:drug/metabolite transporter (DMT)-like permease/nitroimidazol reductase NimA-like FMN-containing flavoprotein (pyridoxamine 5'-phosphate oxidase superfamily)